MDLLAIGGLAALLLVKEASLPIPLPGDLLVIGAGVALAGDPPLAAAVLAVTLAVGYVGGSVQFVLARRIVRRPLLAALARIGIGEARVEALAQRFRRSGARGVAMARMTPGVRIASIAAAGLAAIPFGAFLAGLVAGNGVFVTAHFALGYLLGAFAADVVARVGAIGLLLVMAALAALGAVGRIVLRRRRSRRRIGWSTTRSRLSAWPSVPRPWPGSSAC
ncbi:MAG: VTT domain-containing protein [Chloroflexi bacterium]|nr:VTT domain-containing protein [Chloroflexota bacterium]